MSNSHIPLLVRKSIHKVNYHSITRLRSTTSLFLSTMSSKQIQVGDKIPSGTFGYVEYAPELEVSLECKTSANELPSTRAFELK